MTTYWCERALVDGSVVDGVEITIEDGRFASVTPGAERTASSERLTGLTIPGLANAHSHAFHRALRARTHHDGGTFWTWRDRMYDVAGRLDPDTYRALARATFAEMVVSGITAVGEFHYVHHQPDGTPYDDPNAMGEAVLAAASEAGLRITLLDTLYLHGGLIDGEYQPATPQQRRFVDAGGAGWAERVDQLRPGAGQMVGAAIHSIRAVDPSEIRFAARWAQTHEAPLHVHAAEQLAEIEASLTAFRATPSAVLADRGAIDHRTTVVHATHSSPVAIELLAEHGATVCICPTTERDLGDGIGPTALLARAGVPMALGSDSHAVIDLLEEARALELDERLRSQRRGVHDPAALLTMATGTGHRSLGWDDAGAIAVGQRADLVTLSWDSARLAGTPPSAAAVVFAASAADVTDVLVDGEHVVRDGRHVRIDVAAELDRAITAVTA